MTVAVTGASGHLGRKVADLLLERLDLSQVVLLSYSGATSVAPLHAVWAVSTPDCATSTCACAAAIWASLVVEPSECPLK